MCGLSGIISADSIGLLNLKAMTDVITHRGPDGQGYSVIGQHDNSIKLENFSSFEIKNHFNLGLAHRRLAIIDTTQNGIQPLLYSKNHLICFNGEIYNYLELKIELESLGHTFTTQTDTEVACAAFAQWGYESMDRMHGMWAMAYVNLETGELILSRDRYGIKPLYYSKNAPNLFVFSSEAKQILKVIDQKPTLNYSIASDFLGYGISDHKRETFFNEIFELEPGHYLKINLKNGIISESIRWYNFKSNNSYKTSANYSSDFRKVFDSSIREHLRSDVAIGSCLSGGLDSSSIVATVNELRGENNGIQKTFSFVPVEEKYSEKKYIDIVLSGRKIESHTITPKENDLNKHLSKIIYHQDFPFASTSIFAQWLVFESAKLNDVKVMLDGQGADEVLGGYHAFFKIRLFSLFKQARFFKFIKQLNDLSPHEYGIMFGLQSVLLGLTPQWIEEFFRKLLKKNDGEKRYFSLPRDQSNPRSYKAYKINSMLDLSLDQINRSNLPMLLRFEDRNSMAHSIEARVPFLDHRLVEFSLNSPEEWLINGPYTKYILREAMIKRLPKEITHRLDKMGFVTPEESWMRENSEDRLALLEELYLESKSILKVELVEDFKRFIRNEIPYNQAFWRAFVFGLWRREFEVKL